MVKVWSELVKYIYNIKHIEKSLFIYHICRVRKGYVRVSLRQLSCFEIKSRYIKCKIKKKYKTLTEIFV